MIEELNVELPHMLLVAYIMVCIAVGMNMGPEKPENFTDNQNDRD